MINNKENELKYGTKENDVISNLFEKNIDYGFGFCFGNIEKYLTRYLSESKKANNQKDIEKIKDYYNRTKEYVTKLDYFQITMFYLIGQEIENTNYKEALKLIKNEL